MSRKGGVLSGGFQPLKAPNAPSVDSVSVGVLSADVTVSAPANTGDGTVSGYVVTAKQSDGLLATGTSSSAGVVSVTLTAGGTTEFASQAFSEYGPGQFSGFGNSTEIPTGLGLGDLYAWGPRGSGGRLGDGSTGGNRTTPFRIGALSNWAQVSTDSATLAVKTDGTLWAWGYNGTGYSGLNNTTSYDSPVQVGALTTWEQCASGSGNGAIKTDGRLWMWGNNSSGQVGINSTINKSSPTQVGTLTNWAQLSCSGANFSGAVKTNGTLYMWGFGGSGQLGNNQTNPRSSPVQIGALTNWANVQMAPGANTAGALKTDGTLWIWGTKIQGQLGNNTTGGNLSSPVQVPTATDWAQFTVGSEDVMAVKTNGTLWGWGRNYRGSLGLGNTVSRSSPVQVGALTNWSQVSMGSAFSLAVKTDGTIWSWGKGDEGVLGLGSTVDKSSPVQIGTADTWYSVDAGRAVLAIQQTFIYP